MNSTVIALLYIVSSVFFIRGIKLLGKTATARKGNQISAIGMAIAVVTVMIQKEVMGSWSSNIMANGYFYIIVAIALGSLIGAIWANRVQMTGMPELVALFNGFGGLSSLLVALSQYVYESSNAIAHDLITGISLGLTIAIGAIAFTGSIVAWGKLSGKMFKKPFNVPAKNQLNGFVALLGLVAIGFYAISTNVYGGMVAVLFATGLFLLLGFTITITIGGGDMPVVISLLNSLSGIAAAFAGFTINNTVLVVAGCLVGASGLILTLIMCKAMNKSLLALLFATASGAKKSQAAGEAKEPKAASVEDAYLVLEAASSVVFIPGYGMAVAQAQHAVKELAEKLEQNGCEVNFAIHPVAGRMPGHMNVLLAEADVAYEQLKTMDEMNPQMANQDVAIVIGANDVVNPAALDDESSPIYGMPIINAFEARTVFVLKRGKGTGFSGIENPLFTNDNTLMIYGDAKNTISSLASEFDDD